MACIHLRRLYQLCQEEKLQLSGSDLIHIVCQQCGVQEACPSALVTSLEGGESDEPPAATRGEAEAGPRSHEHQDSTREV